MEWETEMERETEAATDYFILFRDTDDPAPIDYRQRRRQEDLLIGDRASYVWGYAGMLNDKQAKIVKEKFGSNVDKSLGPEQESTVANSDDKSKIEVIRHKTKTSEIRVTLLKPAAIDFLAQVSPNLAFFSHVPLNRKVKIYPESEEEERRILETLTPLSSQRYFGFKLHYNLTKDLEPPKRHKSFVELLSLETLMNIWSSYGYYPHMDLLRRTAEIWVIQILEKNERHIKTSEENLSLEDTEAVFKSIVHDDKNYIPTLTPRQLDVLSECVDIVNTTRALDGYSNENIKNKYEYETMRRRGDVDDYSQDVNSFRWDFVPMVEPSLPPRISPAESGQGVPPIILSGKHTKQGAVPTVAPSGTPPIVLAARKKTKKKSSAPTDDAGRKTYDKNFLENMPLVNAPDETHIKKIDLDACKAIAIAIEREKQTIKLLSIPQQEKELEKIHVEILSERGYKPLVIAALIYPDASDAILREKAKWISKHVNKQKDEA